MILNLIAVTSNEIVRHGGEVDQIDSSQSNKSKFCQSKAIKDAGLQDLRVTIRLATELPLKQSTVACLAGPTEHTYTYNM